MARKKAGNVGVRVEGEFLASYRDAVAKGGFAEVLLDSSEEGSKPNQFSDVD